MARNLSRDAKLFVQKAGTGVGTAGGTPQNDTNTWEVRILDGFSFSQDSATQDVTIAEAGDAPTRGMKQYTTALNPVDFSFSAYVKPFFMADDDAGQASITKARASSVEGILWNALISAVEGVGTSQTSSDVTDSGITTAVTISTGEITAGNVKYDFSGSEVHELLKLDLLFNFENNTYKIANAQINSAEIDFSIDGIAMITWSGQGTTLSELTETEHGYIGNWVAAAEGDGGSPDYYPAPANVATGCVKNRFSTMYLIDRNTGSTTINDYFKVAITGGTITIDNGITYLTPEELGTVNNPCASFTGTRSITGSVTAYIDTYESALDPGTYDGTTEAKGWPTGKLLDTMLNLTDATNTNFDLMLRMGGADTATPRVDFYMDRAHLVIPTVNVEDVIATEISFTGQGSTGLEATDELTVTYYPEFTAAYDDITGNPV